MLSEGPPLKERFWEITPPAHNLKSKNKFSVIKDHFPNIKNVESDNICFDNFGKLTSDFMLHPAKTVLR